MFTIYVNILYIYFNTDTNTTEKRVIAKYETLENPEISKNIYVQ